MIAIKATAVALNIIVALASVFMGFKEDNKAKNMNFAISALFILNGLLIWL